MTQAVNLPNAWTEISLGEICHRITKGTTPTSLGFEFASEGILFVKVESLSDKNINHSLCSFISPEADEALSRSQLKENDILFSIAGTLGRVAIVRKDDLPANTNQALSIIRLIPPVYPPYIAEALSSRLLDATIRRDGRGVGIRNLNLKQVSEFSIPLPPLNEQRRIVAKIEELRAHTLRSQQALDEIPALIDQFRQSVLAAAFRGDLTADWRKKNPDVEPAEQLLERIREERRQKWEEAELEKMRAKGKEPKNDTWKKRYKEPIGITDENQYKLPRNWSWMTLGEVAWYVKDGPHYSPKYSESGIPFISGGNIKPEGIDFENIKYISFQLHKELSERCAPEYGDILYTKGGTTGIARVNTYKHEFNVWVHVAVLKCVPSINKFYLQHALNSPWCYQQSQKFTHGVGNQDLGLTRMVKILIPLAPMSEQIEIVKRISIYSKIIDSLHQRFNNSSEEIDHLNQSILAKAFRGELVPQDPNDEPASALLDRIRAEREKLGTTKTPKRSSRKRSQ